MEFLTIAVGDAVDAISAALDLLSLDVTTALGFQMNGGTASDTFDIYESNRSAIATAAQAQTQAQKIVSVNGLFPSDIGGVRQRYLYVVRTAAATAGLSLLITGQSSINAANANAILQGGNAFAAEIDIGPTDGNAMVIGAGGGFAASSCTAITLDTTTTGPINIGTGAAAKTITIGNATGATSVVLNAGTGNIDIGTGAQARTTRIATGAAEQIVTIGSTSGASSMTIDAGTGDMLIGTGAQDRLTSIATGAAVQTVTVGSTNSTSSLTLDSGTGAINIGTGAQARDVNVGTGAAVQRVVVGSQTGASTTVIDAGTGALDIGTGAQARTTRIATGAAAQIVTVGSTDTTSSLTLQAGTGNIEIGSFNAARSINVGVTAAVQAITVGSTFGASTLTLEAGTGALAIGSTPAIAHTITIGNGAGAVQTVSIATAAVANVVTIGSTTGAAALTLQAGTGAINLNGPTRYSVVAAGDAAAGGNIGGLAAAASVDIASFFTVNQTTAGQVLTLPSPTTATVGRVAIVTNIGTQSFTMYGKTVTVAATPQTASLFLTWNGTAWTATA